MKPRLEGLVKNYLKDIQVLLESDPKSLTADIVSQLQTRNDENLILLKILAKNDAEFESVMACNLGVQVLLDEELSMQKGNGEWVEEVDVVDIGIQASFSSYL
jgi:hypothetical protein